MIEITVGEAVAIMLWIAFVVGVGILIFNEWDQSIKSLDEWEDE